MAGKRGLPPRAAQNSSPTPPGSPSPNELHPAHVPPFFNTTFALYRVSPLHVGKYTLAPKRLEELARRLRDTLIGDVVRGIQIGVEATETPWGQVGPLEAINVRWFHAKDILGDAVVGLEDGSDTDKEGLWIEICHANAAYHAIMLPGFGNSRNQTTLNAASWLSYPGETAQPRSVDESHFLQLPLMLMRMPQALQNIVGQWLSTTFDCRVSKLSIGTKTITGTWEGWLQASDMSHMGSNVVLTLAFHNPAPDPQSTDKRDEPLTAGLRTVEVSVAPQDLRRFVRTGKSAQPPQKHPAFWDNDSLERRRLAGNNAEDGWGWLTSQHRRQQPFTESLALYLEHHLALDLFHPSVRVVQVACDGFVLASSRLKIVRHGEMTDELSRAAWVFIMHLGKRIQGEVEHDIF